VFYTLLFSPFLLGVARDDVLPPSVFLMPIFGQPSSSSSLGNSNRGHCSPLTKRSGSLSLDLSFCSTSHGDSSTRYSKSRLASCFVNLYVSPVVPWFHVTLTLLNFARMRHLENMEFLTSPPFGNTKNF